ncbi:hypothetical protein TNCV_414631 [Trichonephila clavipes]|nr:hypothetical protein TNCV_414631 [Trichonephila clavipes]
MKTAGWPLRRIGRQVDRSECAVRNCWGSGHEKVPTCGKPGLERTGRPRGERIKGSCGKARVRSAKTADAIVSLCTLFRVGCLRFVGPSVSGQHKVSNQLNAGRVAACVAAGDGPTRY